MNLGQSFFQATRYLHHLSNRTHVQVLHSPFVYQLYTNCINKDEKSEVFAPIEQLRSRLLNNHTSLTYTDLGAGSVQRRRTLADIAGSSLKPPRQARLLHRLIRYFKPNTCLEMGTSLGITTCYLARALEQNGLPYQLTTIDGAAELQDIQSDNFSHLGINSTVVRQSGNFDNLLLPYLNSIAQLDFAFVDGNHRKAPTLLYFDQLCARAHNDTILVFDDIHWSEEMNQAWEAIKADQRVTVTIDLYHMGLVFFRKEQVKQHFNLKF